MIIAPTGEIAARALGEVDEVINATLDLELGEYIRRTIFNFEKHRRIEHYRLTSGSAGELAPTVAVFKADDVVLAEIAPGLHFD